MEDEKIRKKHKIAMRKEVCDIPIYDDNENIIDEEPTIFYICDECENEKYRTPDPMDVVDQLNPRDIIDPLDLMEEGGEASIEISRRISKYKTDHLDFPSLLRSVLEELNEYDPDRATQKNGVGFNRKDGEFARELLTKEKWDKKDVKTALQIAQHYKNTQLKDQWKKISEIKKEYLKELKARKKSQIAEGLWVPIKQEDDIDIAFLGWKDGWPFKRKIEQKRDDIIIIDEKVILKEDYGEPIQDLIKRFIGEYKREYIEFKGEVFTKPEFVNLMVYPSNVNNFTECLNALPIEPGEYREPNFYFKNDHILFPEKFYARRDDSYQKILKDALKIKMNEENKREINMELYRE
ncbi:hypothetical protein [Caldiplasma sukawensis]